MDLTNSNGFELRNFYFITVWKLSLNFFSEVEKCSMWSSIQALTNQLNIKSFCTFQDIGLRESHGKIHKKPSETLGVD